MEKQIKAELARIQAGIKTHTISVTRKMPGQMGDFTFSVEADIQGLAQEEVAVASCLLGLRAEQAVLRHVHSAGSMSDESYQRWITEAKQGFSRTAALLVGGMLAKGGQDE